MSERRAIRGVLFETDGVLYHYPRQNPHLATFLVGHGLTLRHPSIVQRALRAAQFDVYTGRITRETFYDAVLRVHGLTDPALFAAGREALLHDASEPELYPGVWETLVTLRDVDLRLGVVTDSPHPMGDLLAWLAVRNVSPSLWTAFVVSADVGATCAEPVIFKRALERMGCPPDETAFVGQTSVSLTCARGLGLMTVGFLPDDPAVQTDCEARTFYDLATLFGAGK